MRRFGIAALVIAVVGTGLSVFPAPAAATLHGYCAGTGQCIDNGTNSPTTNNPPQNFGFVSSPSGETGQFRIDILVPNNEAASPPGSVSFGITGNNASSVTSTATLFSTTAFTSGQLDAYLGSVRHRRTRLVRTCRPRRRSILVRPGSSCIRRRSQACQH